MKKKQINTNNSTLGPRARVVYQKMLKDIASSIFPAGEKLPTEMELCERYSVSRSCLRQALKALDDEGKIYSRQGSGSYVSDHVEQQDQLSTISVMYHGNLDDIRVIQQMILEQNCLMNLFSQRQEGWDPNLERLFLTQVLQQKHKGILASCTPIQPRNEDVLAKLAKSGCKVIHIEPYDVELPNENYLMPDYQRAGYAAAVHLMLQGYETLYFYKSSKQHSSPFLELLSSGFEAAVKDHNKTFDYIDEDDFNHLFIQQKPKQSCGIFSGVYEATLALKQKVTTKWNITHESFGFLSVELTGDNITSDDNMDYIHFNRYETLGRAVSIISKSPDSEIKELVPPVIKSAK